MCEERNNWFAEKTNHSFDDVTGMDELKTELKNDHEHAFLFYGDNGCGKTYLAEQILQEAEQILQEGDSTLEEMEQMLAEKGELEELIDLSDWK